MPDRRPSDDSGFAVGIDDEPRLLDAAAGYPRGPRRSLLGVADLLEGLARDLRARGIEALAPVSREEHLAAVIRGVVAGYLLDEG